MNVGINCRKFLNLPITVCSQKGYLNRIFSNVNRRSFCLTFVCDLKLNKFPRRCQSSFSCHNNFELLNQSKLLNGFSDKRVCLSTFYENPEEHLNANENYEHPPQNLPEEKFKLKRYLEETVQYAEPRTVSRLQSIVKCLENYQFTRDHLEMVFEQVGSVLIENEKITSNTIEETIECWKSVVKLPNLRQNQLDKVSRKDYDLHDIVDFRFVVSEIEPYVLLMPAEAITHRIDNLLKIGVIHGKTDFWRLLCYAPRAWYLQEWVSFMKKIHYLNFYVYEWLYSKKQDFELYPHPFVRFAKVLEFPYEEIRARHLFATRTGLKVASTASKLGVADFLNRIDLGTIYNPNVQEYLDLIAPHCRFEEYEVFVRLLETEHDRGSDIIDELIELENEKFAKKAPNPESQGLIGLTLTPDVRDLITQQKNY